MTIPAQTPATVDAAGIGTPETATMVTAEPQAPKKRTFFSQLRASLAMFANPKSAAGLIILPVSNLNWGTILFWAQQNSAFPDYWWWYVPAGLCIALLGMALALINFGIDEYVNPRLRSAGERAR